MALFPFKKPDHGHHRVLGRNSGTYVQTVRRAFPGPRGIHLWARTGAKSARTSASDISRQYRACLISLPPVHQPVLQTGESHLTWRLGSRRAVVPAKSGGQGVEAGGMFLEFAEKTQLPGFSRFSGRRNLALGRGQRRFPEKKLHFRGSRLWGFVIC